MRAPQGIHLVGSTPFKSTREHFDTIGSRLGPYLQSISDGETSPPLRQNWLACQTSTFKQVPWILKQSIAFLAEKQRQDARLDIISEADLPNHLENLSIGYDEWAIASYAIFKDLKTQGILPKHLKFQVGIPSTTSLCLIMIKPEYRTIVEPFYEAATIRALRNIQDSIPHGELVIQFEVVAEFMFLEKIWTRNNTMNFDETSAPWFGTKDEEIRDKTFKRLDKITSKDSVDSDVMMGFHLCYGDFNHKHFLEPESAKHIADVAEYLISAGDRQVNYIHFPMPGEKYDEAYLEHLRALWPKLQAGGTYLYIGLVHGNDQEGTKKRIEAAKSVFGSSGWGIANECGLSRTPEAEFEGSLAMYGEITRPWH